MTHYIFKMKDDNYPELDEQKTILDKTLDEWKGNLEQVDDILLFGFRA